MVLRENCKHFLLLSHIYFCMSEKKKLQTLLLQSKVITMTPQNKEKFNKELKVARSRICEVQERYKGDNQFYLMISLVENLVQVLHNNYKVQ